MAYDDENTGIFGSGDGASFPGEPESDESAAGEDIFDPELLLYENYVCMKGKLHYKDELRVEDSKFGNGRNAFFSLLIKKKKMGKVKKYYVYVKVYKDELVDILLSVPNGTFIEVAGDYEVYYRPYINAKKITPMLMEESRVKDYAAGRSGPKISGDDGAGQGRMPGKPQPPVPGDRAPVAKRPADKSFNEIFSDDDGDPSPLPRRNYSENNQGNNLPGGKDSRPALSSAEETDILDRIQKDLDVLKIDLDGDMDDIYDDDDDDAGYEPSDGNRRDSDDRRSPSPQERRMPPRYRDGDYQPRREPRPENEEREEKSSRRMVAKPSKKTGGKKRFFGKK